MTSLHLGPLALPMTSVIMIASLILTFWLGNWIARKQGVNVEISLWLVLGAGLVAGRGAFLLAYWKNYAGNPWTILDVRDGGFSILAGLAGALIAAVLLFRLRKAARKPLAIALFAGLSMWAGGTALLLASSMQGRLPEVELAGLDGKPLKLVSLSGKPIVINLWATWCPPCRREMPVLRDAQQANPDVVFVFANQGEPREAVKEFLNATGLTLGNVMLDRNGAVAKQTGASAMPTTLVFDSDGRLVASRVGEVSAAKLAQLLEAGRKGR
ncbi:MAG TPA: TlpA disulfide reductase family protein [Noviherbaspirillum sp.]|uniref:TlpA disulfide reductase family protein n=1 Tax=Noviherbaspirillum sp. TaxID=1926288 RepID=UPI002B496F82|nr:TlpA disulfide reductase family protein [Noviherbaspirillum sp.]HJV85244.1 TlpA disulfide reductase family protein [Noviherbaspirillum sp.]